MARDKNKANDRHEIVIVILTNRTFMEYHEYVNNAYKKISGLNKEAISTFRRTYKSGETEFYTEPDYDSWFTGVDSICCWCKIIKTEENKNVIIDLSSHYINIWRPLLHVLSQKCESWNWNVSGIYHEFTFNAIYIGTCLYHIEAYTQAISFFLDYIDLVRPLLFLQNFDGILWSYCYIVYLCAACQKKVNNKEKGIAVLKNLIEDLKKIEDFKKLVKIEADTYVHVDNSSIIGMGYDFLGSYYDVEPRDIKSAIKAYESAIEHEYYPAAKDLGKLYAELDMIDKEKALYEKILKDLTRFKERPLGDELNHTKTMCQERLAGIYKDEFNYKEAVRLYQQLITNAEPLNQVQYKDEMYRCMAFLEVDTAETLEILEKMHHNHLATEGQASLESVKDLRALAYAYVSYANSLKQSGDITGYDSYRTAAEETYQKFFEDARPLVSEALKKDNVEKLLPYVREYAYVLQGYLELLDEENISHLFDLVASYQAFTFEIDQLKAEPDLWQSLQQEDISTAIAEQLREDTAVLNYVLHYKNHRKRYGVFLLKQDVLEFYDLGDATDISEQAAGFTDAVTDIQKDPTEACNDLNDTLLGPLSKALGDIEELYVIRETGLESIPFHFLTGKDTMELISVRALLMTDRNRMDMSHVTIFSDPKYSFDDHEIRPDPYPALTGSHIEAEMIENVYGASVCRHSGRDASVSELRQAAEKSDAILHISSHHIRTYEKNSGYMAASRLIMAGANNLEMTEEETKVFGKDGTVSAADLNTQQMKPKLVILAACQSANGITVEGGGGFGLARAFYNHGCRVVSALYQVGDFASAVFFYFFYQDLKQSEDPDSAIRFARDRIQKTDKDKVEDILLRSISKESSAFKRLRRELRHLGEYPFRHPFFWSGFILGGL